MTTMTHSGWLNLLIIVSIIGAAEEVLRRLVGKPIARVWAKVERFLDTWNGEPARDGLDARPGLVDRVIAMEVTQREQLALAQSMHHELHPNSGLSLRDAVDRTERTLREHVEQSAALVEQGRDSEAEIRDLIQHGQDEDAEIRATIAKLADAVAIAAQSTPPKETP